MKQKFIILNPQFLRTGIKMKKILQLFVIWENGRNHEDKIMRDIAAKYDILQTFSICWPAAEFAQNLSRFYGKKIPAGCKKEKECGTGAFTLIVAYDTAPKMVEDSRHPELKSNYNAVRDKSLYRQWTGGGYLVHASDNPTEAAENLLFMLGMSPREIEEKYTISPSKEKITLTQSMIGTNGWNSLNELQSFIAKLPETRLHHSDTELVITTSNFAATSRLLNLKKRFNLFKKNQYIARIGGKNCNVLMRAI